MSESVRTWKAQLRLSSAPEMCSSPSNYMISLESVNGLFVCPFSTLIFSPAVTLA